MEKANYKKLSFKCGLEIHQQLETHKLFCKCPSLVNDPNKKKITIQRYLRAPAGETGHIDIAALHELKKGKYFIYEAKPTSSCQVELDESPPEELNHDALETALQVALILNCELVDEVIFMRKTVIDGSNTSGFQRTALIGLNGYINTSKGEVKIETVCLEEESAKKIKEDSLSTNYSLDRLGVPLIEIATDASIKDPEHCKEVASYLGMVLRSTGKVKRGLGSIRQDVNLSIKGSSRVELKGFQDLRSIPKVIESEVKRLIKTKNHKAEVRKVESNFISTFLRPMPGASRLYPETDIKEILITKKLLAKISIPELIDEKALKLEKEYNLNSYLARELIKANVNFDLYKTKFENLQSSLIASIIVEIPKEIKSRFNIDYKFKESDFEFILNELNQGKIPKDSALSILVEIAKGKKPKLEKYRSADEKEVEDFIKNLVSKNKELSINALMGMVMKHYKGSVEGSLAMKILKKYHK